MRLGKRKVYKINQLLVRMAAEDGAQQATRIEITRQLAVQGVRVVIPHLNWDIDMSKTLQSINVDGVAIEWTDEPL